MNNRLCTQTVLVCQLTFFLLLNTTESLALEKEQRIRYATNHQGHAISLIIEGEIEKGDADYFLELIKRHKGELETVHLMSPGGSAVEAIKLGRIIRSLKMTTFAPLVSPSQPNCLHKPIEPQNCTCTSACFFIFVSGYERYGHVLGIHRVFVRHDYLKKLSESEALTSSKEAKEIVTTYFNEMGVPSLFLDRALSTASGQIDFLSKNEINKYFTGYIPEYAEWLTARCGDTAKLWEEEKKVMVNSRYYNEFKNRPYSELLAKDPQVSLANQKTKQADKCKDEISKNMRREAYKKIYQ